MPVLELQFQQANVCFVGHCLRQHHTDRHADDTAVLCHIYMRGQAVSTDPKLLLHRTGT